MMPRVHDPKLKRRFQKNDWEIYWSWNYNRYIVFPGGYGADDGDLVESELRLIAAALAAPLPEFPEKYADMPGVTKYLADRHKIVKVDHDFNDLFDQYMEQVKLEKSKGWHRTTSGHIKAFKKSVEDIGKATPV